MATTPNRPDESSGGPAELPWKILIRLAAEGRMPSWERLAAVREEVLAEAEKALQSQEIPWERTFHIDRDGNVVDDEGEIVDENYRDWESEDYP